MARNEPTYEFDVVNLRTKKITSFRTAVNAIERRIKKVLQEEEFKMNLEIKRFSIGKTYTHKIKKAYILDPLDENTFTKKGISDRWRVHRETDYGKDGMVVVAIITDDVADTLDYDDAEDCALNIERKLQDQFKSDKRLIHEDYHQGARVEYPADGYPLYITYAFTEQSPHLTRSHQSYYYNETSNFLSPSLSLSSSLPPSLPSFLPSSSSLFSFPPNAFVPHQRETYPLEPQYLPPLQTGLYWPIWQQQQFHQTYLL